MKLVVASHNQGKLREFARIFSRLGIEMVPQDDLCPNLQVEETGTTFAENARLKAMAVYRATGLPAVADDSGLCIDALNGEPGVYSARYGGEDLPHTEKMKLVLARMEQVPRKQRTARFVSAICCVFSLEDVLETEGVCEGWIGYEPRGTRGFGYDPIFYVGEQSYAEITDEEKDQISHRGRALAALDQKLEERFSSR